MVSEPMCIQNYICEILVSVVIIHPTFTIERISSIAEAFPEFKGSIPQNEKRNVYKFILLSVCLSVYPIFQERVKVSREN